MEIGRAHMTFLEQRHRLTNNSCLYCEEAGHMAVACPVKKRCSPLRGQNTVSITNTLLMSC